MSSSNRPYISLSGHLRVTPEPAPWPRRYRSRWAIRVQAWGGRCAVVKERDGGVVRRVRLVDGGEGEPVTPACRFLDHLVDRGFSPHTICAYAYDLRRLFTFLAAEKALSYRSCWASVRAR
ncbi:site-specific integrase [Streptomyces sp. BE308]|uniref:site-specific integrase n=1 Tax=Streptomyces sp. BE308 TaxID=3002529 RepID=UPI002E78FCCA|nr:site-specific integrase [Streptomyces sp. BE308]MEE1791084.1 site-specific integrase [Streptomyces sp. BE308]